MARLRLRADQPVGEILRLVSVGTVSRDEWEKVVADWKPRGNYSRPLETFTLRHYGRLVAQSDDLSAVLVHVNASGIRTYPTAEDIPAEVFLDTLKGLRADMTRVAEAFKNMPRQSLTADEIAAGFDKLDFGLFGIIDTLACRQGVSDEVIKDMTLADVLGKLNIIATRAACERRLTEIRNRRTR